jgi:outer membrane protein assembly factor BamB
MRITFILIVFFLILRGLIAQEISQWRGPERSGWYPDTGLLQQWPEEGPKLLWTATGMGKGFSSPAVTKDAVFITGMKDTTDYLMKLSKTGELLWEIPFGRSWYNSFPDTRCTPTVEDNRVYVISGAGIIACIDADSGEITWTFNAVEKFDGKWGDWGVCESLLLVDDKVIYTPAGPRTTMVALDKKTGETFWESASLNDSSAYVSPLLIEIVGRKIIVTLIARYLIGVDSDNGEIIWKFDYASLLPEESLKVWPGAPFTNTNTPLFSGNRLYITGGYDHPGAMFELSEDGSQINLMWTDATLDCHIGGVVLADGYIYGANWINNASGNWCCIDWNTGAPRWKEKWFTKGSVITTEGLLFCYEEKSGNVGLVRTNPERFELLSHFRITEGTGPFWAHPVIHDGALYIRHGDALMAFDIRSR